MNLGPFELLFDLDFVLTALTAILAFAAILTVALPMASGDRLGARLKAVAERREELRRQSREALQKSSKKGQLRQVNAGFMKSVVDRLGLANVFDAEAAKEQLARAGLRGPRFVTAFMFARIAGPIAAFAGALVYLFVLSNFNVPPMGKVAIAFGAGALGFYLPDVFVQNLIQRRTESIMRAFPDALDLLLICVESGMSVEAAFNKVATEIGSQSVELAEEFALTTAELSYLPDRKQAYENLGRRAGHPGVRAVVTSLIQAERYGTPLGTALRVTAQENRDMRMTEAEKKAAALPAKLTVPMIAFFLPVLFVVILGPAIINVMGVE